MTKEIINLATNEVLAKEAYARVKNDWTVLKADQLLKVNLDVPTAAQTVLGALPEVNALRERIVAELPSFDMAALDKLEDFALALISVHSRYVMATQPPDDLAELSAAASALRERLTSDAKTLAVRGLFDPRKVAALKGSIGYRNVGLDLQSLSEELEAVWPQISGKCAVTLEELKAAGQMATRLLRVVGVRDQAPAVLAALVEERMRAFTMVIKIWEDARAAIAFLRRAEDDVESITPNLYTGKSTRTKASEPDAEGGGEGGSGTTGSGTVPPPAGTSTPGGSAPGTPAAGTSSTPTSAEISKKGPFVS